MAVQSETSSVSYSGNGSTTTAYVIPFYFLDNSHLEVVVKDNLGNVLPVSFTASGAGNQSGGSLTTSNAVPATFTLTISRVVPATQLTSYLEGGPFPAASHERALDKLTMISQQIARGNERTIRFSAANPVVNEIAVYTPNRVVGINSAGVMTLLPPVQAGLKFKGTLTNVNQLPATADEGDAWGVNNDIHVYSEGAWVIIGSLGTGQQSSEVLTNQGDILTRDNSQNIRLPLGTQGRYLRAGALQPEWDDVRPEYIISPGVLNRQVIKYNAAATAFQSQSLTPFDITDPTAADGNILKYNLANQRYETASPTTQDESLVQTGVIVRSSRDLGVNFICLDGADVSRSINSALFNIYGETHGGGNGSTTFGLPYPPPSTTNLQADCTSLPAARWAGTMVKLNDGRFCYMGGISGTSTRQGEVYLGVLKGKTITWTQATDTLPSQRSEGAAVVLADGRIVYIGGAASGGAAQNSVYIGTPTANNVTWVNSSFLGTARKQHQAVRLHDGRIFIAGGDNGGVGLNSTEIGVVNGNAITWSSASVLPSPTREFAMDLIPLPPTGATESKFVMSGGWTSGSTNRFNSVIIGTIANGSLSIGYVAQTPLPVWLSQHRMHVLTDRRLLVLGGMLATTAAGASAATSNCYLGTQVGPALWQWTLINALSVAIRDHSSCQLSDGRILIEGGWTTAASQTSILRTAGPFDYIRR